MARDQSKASIADRGAVLAAVLVLLSVGLPLALSAPAAADGLAQFDFEPSTIEAQPGETFTVDLNLQSNPQFANGATEVGVVVTFDRTYVNATDIERGSFMNLRDETTIETNRSAINNSVGYLVYELVRDPAKSGTYGYGTFATLTFEVAEDAPNGTFDISVYRARILLADGMQQQVRKATATGRVTGANPVASDRPATSTPTASESAFTPQPGGQERTNTPVADAGSNAGAGGGVGFGGAGTIVALGGAMGLFGGMVVLMRKYVPATGETSKPSASDEPAEGAGSPSRCPVCSDAFESDQAVRDHAWDAHGACQHCGASFGSREELYTHWLDHEDQLSRIDRQKARRAAGSAAAGGNPSSGGVQSLAAGNRRAVLLGFGGVALVALVFAAGYAIGGGSPLDGVPGGPAGEVTESPVDEVAGEREVSIGTPSGPVGPEGYNVTRQSTTTIDNPGSVHWHAEFSVRIYDQRVDFARSSYMLRSKYVHFENGDGTTIHKHATGVTLTDFFLTIDWRLTDECLITPDGSRYCSGDGGTLNIIVNGNEVDEPAAYRIQDGDQIRIIYERPGENS